MPRTRQTDNLSYDEANQPYIKPGTIFRPKKYKHISEYGNTPGEVFYDHVTGQALKPREFLMYLEYLGDAEIVSKLTFGFPTLKLPKNKFWNLRTRQIVILSGYHWWIEDEMEQYFEDLDEWK